MKFKYMAAQIDGRQPDQSIQALNIWGAKGWEVVSVLPHPDGLALVLLKQIEEGHKKKDD